MITMSVAERHNARLQLAESMKEPSAVYHFLTGALFGETAGVSEQLEGLLEPRGVLRGSIGGLDVGNEGGHFPLCLASRWGEQTLVALVQRTGADRICHRQDRHLQEEEEQGHRHDILGVLISTDAESKGRPPDKPCRAHLWR